MAEVVEKIKCRYCKKEISKINLKGHEEDCSENHSVIGGWLLFFEFMICINIIISIYYVFFDYYPSLITAMRCSLLILLILQIYVLNLMNRRKKLFKKIVILYMWTPVTMLLFAIAFEAFDLTAEQFNIYLNSIDYVKCLVYLIGAFVWTIYFLKSDRVKKIFVK